MLWQLLLEEADSAEETVVGVIIVVVVDDADEVEASLSRALAQAENPGRDKDHVPREG